MRLLGLKEGLLFAAVIKGTALVVAETLKTIKGATREEDGMRDSSTILLAGILMSTLGKTPFGATQVLVQQSRSCIWKQSINAAAY